MYELSLLLRYSRLWPLLLGALLQRAVGDDALKGKARLVPGALSLGCPDSFHPPTSTSPSLKTTLSATLLTRIDNLGFLTFRPGKLSCLCGVKVREWQACEGRLEGEEGASSDGGRDGMKPQLEAQSPHNSFSLANTDTFPNKRQTTVCKPSLTRTRLRSR